MSQEHRSSVPTGIDYLLSLAATDDSFRERLLENRLKAARRAGVRLSPSEQTLLTAMPDEQLRATVANAAPERAPRRGFLQRTSMWVAGIFGGLTLTSTIALPGCAPRSKGCQSDMPQSAGERPDVPPPNSQVDTGARPDLPPDKEKAGEEDEAGE